MCVEPTTGERRRRPCTLAPIFAGVESVTTPYSGVCTLDVTWATARRRHGPLSYNVYRSTVANSCRRRATWYVGLEHPFTDFDALVDGRSTHYVVRAVDGSNGVEETNTAHASNAPRGQFTRHVQDDGGDTGRRS
jgi:hypothetical protein